MLILRRRPEAGRRPERVGTGLIGAAGAQRHRYLARSRNTTGSPVARSVATIPRGIRISSNRKLFSSFRKNSAIRSLPASPMRLMVHLATSPKRMAEPMPATSAAVAPLEKAAAANEPALTPATQCGDVSFLEHLQNARISNTSGEAAPAQDRFYTV